MFIIVHYLVQLNARQVLTINSTFIGLADIFLWSQVILGTYVLLLAPFYKIALKINKFV